MNVVPVLVYLLDIFVIYVVQKKFLCVFVQVNTEIFGVGIFFYVSWKCVMELDKEFLRFM